MQALHGLAVQWQRAVTSTLPFHHWRPCSAAFSVASCSCHPFAAPHKTCSSKACLSSLYHGLAEHLAAAELLRVMSALHGIGVPRRPHAFMLPSLFHFLCSAAVSWTPCSLYQLSCQRQLCCHCLTL